MFEKEFTNCANVKNFLDMFAKLSDKCANVQNANVQICKCAKNRRAQNAQICSANYFPNAEITNLQMHKSALCTISVMQIFCSVQIFFVCNKLIFLFKKFNLNLKKI